MENTNCESAYITCPATATTRNSFSITYGASDQPDPAEIYPKVSLRVWNSSNNTELKCDEFTSTGDDSPTGDKTVNAREPFVGTMNYTLYCSAITSGNSICGSKAFDTSTSIDSCEVTILPSSQNNITLYKGWNLVSFITDTYETGIDKNISVSQGWNLIGHSSNISVNLSDVNFTNSTGSRFTWQQAINAGKVKAYLRYLQNKTYKYVGLPGSGMHDYALRDSVGYWVYIYEVTGGNITLPGVGGAATGQITGYADLRFINGTAMPGGSITPKTADEAQAAGWVFSNSPADKIWYSNPGLLVDLDNVCEAMGTCDATTISAWRGYYIWSNYDNVIVMRN